MKVEKKININKLHFAEIEESSEGTLSFGTPELIADVMEVGKVPQVSAGSLYGDGKVSHNTSKVTSHQVTINHNKIPTKWRRYMEGVTVVNGVESGTSKDEPNPLAVGWEVEKTGGKKELIWFLYGKATPITETVTQSEENINYSTDTVVITFTEHDSLERFYTFIDTETDDEITPEIVGHFFKKVQTTDTISAT